MSIHLYRFLSLCQSKFTPISFNSVFFISVYSSYIHLYLFLSLAYPPLFLYISLSIQIDAYLFQPHFIYLSLILIYPSVSIFISFLSTTISFYRLLLSQPISRISYTYIFFYLFANPNLRLHLSTFFSLFQYIPLLFTSIAFYLLYILLSIQIHAYLFQYLSLLADFLILYTLYQ